MLSNIKQSGTISSGLSDHSLVYLILGHNTPKAKPEIFSFRSFRHFVVEDFVEDLCKIQWNDLLSSEEDVEYCWEKFSEAFKALADKHAPHVTVRNKLNGSPWITTEYLALSRDRDYYKRKFDKLKKSAEAGQETNELWNEYKYLRNKVNILNKKLKRDFFRNKFQQCANKLQDSWKVLKKLLPKKKVSVNPNINTGTHMTSDKVEIATSFNELFVSIGKRHSPLNQQSFNSLNTLSKVGSTFKFQKHRFGVCKKRT